jgi:hypothetical protein
MNVERPQPLREGASSSDIDVFPNVEHDSIITYTLASTAGSGIGQVTICRPAFTDVAAPVLRRPIRKPGGLLPIHPNRISAALVWNPLPLRSARTRGSATRLTSRCCCARASIARNGPDAGRRRAGRGSSSGGSVGVEYSVPKAKLPGNKR